MLYIQRSEEQRHGEYINFTSGQMFLWDPLYGRMLSQPPILKTFGPDLMFPCIPLYYYICFTWMAHAGPALRCGGTYAIVHI